MRITPDRHVFCPAHAPEISREMTFSDFLDLMGELVEAPTCEACAPPSSMPEQQP